jgi:hypothetical protein
MSAYLKTFFGEKNLDSVIYEVEGPSGVNHIPTECVIEAILIAPRHEQKAIADTLRKIDFYNGDVHHYLRHLAQAIAV